MNNDMQPKTQTTDEIDLLELFNRMGRSIKKGVVAFFNFIVNILLGIIKFYYLNKIFIGIFILIFGLLGLFVSYITKPYYSSTLVGRSNTLSNFEVISMIDNLTKVTESKDSIALSQMLNIKVSEASKIKNINAFWAYDIDLDGVPDFIDYSKNYEIKDTSVRRISDRFYITAEVYDNRIFSNLRIGIYNYIKNNPLIASINNNRIKQTQERISKINEEISKLDSLQKFEYYEKDRIVPKVGANQLVLFTEKDRRLYHEEILGLYNERLALEKSIDVYPEPITIIQDFTPLSKNDNNTIYYIKRFLIIGFILGTIVRFILLYYRKIDEYLLSKNE